MKFILYIAFLICSLLNTNCSTIASTTNERIKTVKGYVVDEQGFPIANVKVKIKNTKRKTTTDADGNFEIKTSENEVLVFSCNLQYEKTKINCKTQVVTVTEQNYYKVKVHTYVNSKKQQRFIRREVRKNGYYKYPD